MVMPRRLMPSCVFLHVSLSVQLHDVVVREAAHWALLAPACAFDARRHMAARDERCVAVSLVAQLAHLGGAVEARGRLLPRGQTGLLGGQRLLVLLLFDLSLLFLFV